MKIQDLHPWDVTPAEARQIQEDLRARIVVSDDVAVDEIRRIAGVDNTYVKEGRTTTAYAVVLILTYPSLEVVETVFASRPVIFPYVPGLLTFREAPAVLAAFEKVTAVPDLVLFDGQGYAHPRRMGLASHLGLVLDLPSVGCAKSRLVGTFEEPARTFGAYCPLVEDGKTVGAAVRTRPRRAPLFVSPGHRVSVETAVELALATCRDGGFVPVPTRMAHDAVTEHARPHRDRLKTPGG